MRIRLGVLAAVSAAALASVPLAQAKGASEARIEGPGLDQAIVVGGNGESGGTPLGDLGQYAAFFPAVFGQSPDPMTTKRPTGELGPRYRITWTVPGPDGDSTLRQDLYPYAQPSPVTYMKPGQRFWDAQRTHGGWYVGDSLLRETLRQAGLPAQPPATGHGSGSSRWIAWVAAALVAALALAVVARRTLRLRPEPAT